MPWRLRAAGLAGDTAANKAAMEATDEPAVMAADEARQTDGTK